MASSLTVQERNGEYRVEIAIGSERIVAVVDTGFTNPRCDTGLCIDALLFDRLAPNVSDLQATRAYSFDNRLHLLRSGLTIASIVGLDGSHVETRVVDGGSNLVGVCFFTRLTGFRIEWAFSDRTMRIWKP